MLLAWLQVTFKAISDVLFLPHRLLAYQQKVCAHRGGGCAATSMGAPKTAPRQRRVGMRLGSHNCFPFSRADLHHPAVPMAKLPPGQGFWGQRTPKWEQSPERSCQPPALADPAQPNSSSAGKGSVQGNLSQAISHLRANFPMWKYFGFQVPIKKE